jgi:hypothetical protein
VNQQKPHTSIARPTVSLMRLERDEAMYPNPFCNTGGSFWHFASTSTCSPFWSRKASQYYRQQDMKLHKVLFITLVNVSHRKFKINRSSCCINWGFTNSDKKKIAYKCVIRNSPGSLPLSVRAITPQPQRDQSESLKQSVKQSFLAARKSKWRVWGMTDGLVLSA